MTDLLALLSELRAANFKLIFVYLHEAHSDDCWPLGYGIQDHKSIEERWAACDALLQKYPAFSDAIDTVAVDCMENSFLHANGAWPERYFFVDKQGTTRWASQVATGDSSLSLTAAREFAASQL